jgi:hypothetical protein
MSIGEIIYSYLPAKRKQTPSGWVKFNAICCHHNGTSADNRARGGMIQNGDGLSYHCFNCGFKASYQPGRHLTRKMRQLLSWLGAPDDVINKITLEAMKIQSDETALEAVSIPKFENKPLPEGSLKISEWLESRQSLPEQLEQDYARVVEYVISRQLDPMMDFYWCPMNGFADRVIIPFRLDGRIVGHTARKVIDGRPKYISDQTPGYVFNLDQQTQDKEFVIVVEGPVDALSIDAVAILGAEIMDKQALLINRLGRRVIVVPDRDADGKRTVEQAILNRYSVSMPTWPEGIKDVNDAVKKLGRLHTLYKIVSETDDSELKIRLKAKQWFLD